MSNPADCDLTIPASVARVSTSAGVSAAVALDQMRAELAGLDP